MSSVSIDRITMRVPGVGHDLGRQLGQQVAERLAPSLELAPGEASLERLHIELAARPGESAEALADRIATRIGLVLGAAGTLEAGR